MAGKATPIITKENNTIDMNLPRMICVEVTGDEYSSLMAPLLISLLMSPIVSSGMNM